MADLPLLLVITAGAALGAALAAACRIAHMLTHIARLTLVHPRS